eukprot:1521954-Amphidinium_carterae.1
MRDQVHQELQELRHRGTQLQEELVVSEQQLQQSRAESHQLGEQLTQNAQESHRADDELLRAELASAQENLSQMAESRVITNRRTQRLEQVEASATQLETMVSRERDELYEQLMQALSSPANQTGAQPSSASAALQTPAPASGVTAPVPQAYSTPAPSQVQQQPQGEANPFLMGTGLLEVFREVQVTHWSLPGNLPLVLVKVLTL